MQCYFLQAILDVSTRNVDEAITISYNSGFVLPPQQLMPGAINVSISRLLEAATDGMAAADASGDQQQQQSVSSPRVPTHPDGPRSGFIVIRTNQSSNAITKIPYSALFLRGHIAFEVRGVCQVARPLSHCSSLHSFVPAFLHAWVVSL